MIRSLVVIPLVLMAASASVATSGLAQTPTPTPREHDACARDVSRLCRAKMNDGDQVVLACLRQNRARLSKACEKVLTEHGQ